MQRDTLTSLTTMLLKHTHTHTSVSARLASPLFVCPPRSYPVLLSRAVHSIFHEIPYPPLISSLRRPRPPPRPPTRLDTTRHLSSASPPSQQHDAPQCVSRRIISHSATHACSSSVSCCGISITPYRTHVIFVGYRLSPLARSLNS